LQGLPAFPFFGCLPEVYQGHFSSGEVTFFSCFGPYLQEKSGCKGRYTSLIGIFVPKASIFTCFCLGVFEKSE